jgi:hypothetical protein
MFLRNVDLLVISPLEEVLRPRNFIYLLYFFIIIIIIINASRALSVGLLPLFSLWSSMDISAKALHGSPEIRLIKLIPWP